MVTVFFMYECCCGVVLLVGGSVAMRLMCSFVKRNMCMQRVFMRSSMVKNMVMRYMMIILFLEQMMNITLQMSQYIQMVTIKARVFFTVMMLWQRSVQKMVTYLFTAMVKRLQMEVIREMQIIESKMLFMCWMNRFSKVRQLLLTMAIMMVFRVLDTFISMSVIVRLQRKKYMGECRLLFLIIVRMIRIFFIRLMMFSVRKIFGLMKICSQNSLLFWLLKEEVVRCFELLGSVG